MIRLGRGQATNSKGELGRLIRTTYQTFRVVQNFHWFAAPDNDDFAMEAGYSHLEYWLAGLWDRYGAQDE